VISELASRLATLDAALRPIANRPVDITQPGWAEQRIAPLDEAGVRVAGDALLADVLSLYVNGSDDEREQLRALYARHGAFAWAAVVNDAPNTEAGFRQQLLLLSLKDQGRDARDEILQLRWLCDEARNAGVAVDAILREVAALSSGVDKYRMGSMREWLSREIPPAA
jgi:hypothetical protein